ncbi:hypothetical protein SD457_11325 [Coprobacillaceae bacterium CR2/5/TPMF4]|nr:hypothetical protein SD457_11325 [Coprobacillaceae bacterium CR2/5/TPMF4]
MLVNAIYNVVDRIFIGNAPGLGAIGIAGITISYPVTLVLMAISLMVGVGGATRFSIALGQKSIKKSNLSRKCDCFNGYFWFDLYGFW